MLLFKEMRITFKAFESEISSLNIDNCSEKSKNCNDQKNQAMIINIFYQN